MISKILIDWIVSGVIDYETASNSMIKRVDLISSGERRSGVWLLEHDHVYTLGVSSKAPDEPKSDLIPVIKTSRGGKCTYHGPGQQIAYLMVKLSDLPFAKDPKTFSCTAQKWIVKVLGDCNVEAFLDANFPGVWTLLDGQAVKIASVGFRIRRGISFHGVCLNVDPDMDRYKNIVACGISGRLAVSLKMLGKDIKPRFIRESMKKRFCDIFDIESSSIVDVPEDLILEDALNIS